MATISELYEHDSPASDYVDVPRWIDADITCADVAAICEGGCASGAYMPAVTYRAALQTMGEHGDEVLDFIEQSGGDIDGDDLVGAGSWSGMAVHLLSMAVEMWAVQAADEIEFEEAQS